MTRASGASESHTVCAEHLRPHLRSVLGVLPISSVIGPLPDERYSVLCPYRIAFGLRLLVLCALCALSP